MARIRPISQEELTGLFKAPQTEPLVSGESITKAIDLADTLATRSVQRQKAMQEIQSEIAKLKAQADQKKQVNQLANLERPTTANTQLSTQVPATLGNIQGGEDIAQNIEANKPAAKSRLSTLINPEEATKRIMAPKKFETADTEEGVLAYNVANPSERQRLGSVKTTGTSPESKDEDRLLKFGETLSLNKNSRSPASQAQISLNNIVRAKALVDQVRTQPGGPDARQTYELALAQVRSLIGSQQISEKEVEALKPSTFKGSALQFLEKAKNEPVGLDQIKFLDRLSDTLNREQTVNNGIVKDFRRQLSTTYGDVIKRHPERSAAILEAHDVDPTPFVPGYKKAASSPNDIEAKKAALRAKLGLK